jgi:plastocyanin
MTLQIMWMFLRLLMPAEADAPHRHTVVMSEFQFAPRELRVSAGDTVVWDNRDIVPHTATANDKSWDSGNIAGKKTRVTVMLVKGEHAFTCLYHSNMKGKLIVK